MSELNIQQEPAQTYQLNVLASALGRFAPLELDPSSIEQSREFCDNIVEAIREDHKPVVPHTNTELLEEAIAFDDKLFFQVRKGRAGLFLSSTLLKEMDAIITNHRDDCLELQSQATTNSMLVEPQTIADAYGLPNIWSDAEAIITDEAKKWEQFQSHPEIPKDLTKRVTDRETQDLMELMWRHVIGVIDYPYVKTYLTEYPDLYHVYWAPLAETLDYATPESYDRATQLSFDLPHNATHLAHLDAIDPNLGVFRYDDSMAQRAYFEAAAVLSELHTIRQLQNSATFRNELYEILDPEELDSDELANWLVRDRGYEFKLRAARYAADMLMIEGHDFRDTTHEIANIFNIPLDDAVKETRKYIAWTGLGAIYTHGYRKLSELNETNVHAALVNADGEAITSWQQKSYST